MSNVYAVILAGGRGLRMGQDKPKQFLPLGEKTILQRSYEAFALHQGVDYIVIVSPGEYIEIIKDMLGSSASEKLKGLCQGGSTRQRSSYNGIKACNAEHGDIILIHDAARPFVSSDIITSCIEAVKLHGAVGTYVKSIDTIAEVKEDVIISIPPRESLYMTQTPQGFEYTIIMDAHRKALKEGRDDATDDVSLVMNECGTVVKVEGTYDNIKITSPADYLYAKFLIERNDLVK